MKFEGQVLVINTTDHSGAVIQSPEFVELEGRRFICGTSVMLDDAGPKWTSGLRVWIAVEHITTITEVPSVDEYVRRCALHRDQNDVKQQKRLARLQERFKVPKA